MLIPIVFASDENYAPYMATAMQSVMENANKEQRYKFIILHKNLQEETIEKLKQQVCAYPYFSIEFANASEEFENFSLKKGSIGAWTTEAYLRLAVPWQFKEYDKIVYMDCDVVCNTDISYIYDIDIGDNLIAGARDIALISIHNNRKYKGLFKSELMEKMDKPENYINSGLLIMNTKEFRRKYTLSYLLDLMQSEDYKFPDQDLLNGIAKDSVFILPQELNFLNTDWDISHAPKNLIEEYCKARENPEIIHYTTSKPWKLELNPPFFHLFWKYSTRTPFIDTIISNMTETKILGISAKDLFAKILKRKLGKK